MARINTLRNFLSDVGNAIKTKNGISGKIPASSFDTYISEYGNDATANSDDVLSPKTFYNANGKQSGGMITTRKPGGFSNNTLETSYTIRAISIEAGIVIINDNGTYKLGKIVNNSIDDNSLTDITLSGTTDIKLCYDGTNLVLFCCNANTMYVYDVNLDMLVITLRCAGSIRYGTQGVNGYFTHEKTGSRIFPLLNNPSYVAIMSFDNIGKYLMGNWTGGASVCFEVCKINGSSSVSLYFSEQLVKSDSGWQWRIDTVNNDLYAYWIPNTKIVCMLETTATGGIGKARRTVKIENDIGTTINSNTDRFYLDDNHYLINNRLYNITDGTSETVSYAENTSNGNFTMTNGKIISLINGALKLYTYNSELETITLDNSYVSADNKYLIQDGNNIVVYSSSATNKSYLMDDGNGDIIAIKRGNTTYYATTESDTVASQVLNKKIVYTSNGKVIGNMPNNGALSYNPSTSQQAIPAGYTSGGTIGAVTSSIDANIVAENIKEDIEILGVTGTFKGGVMTQEEYDECQELADLILGDTETTDLDYVLMNSVVLNGAINANVIQEDNENILVVDDDINLPYTELEYIQSTGTQYIDTLRSIKSNSKIEAELSVTNLITNTFYFGASDNNNSRYYIGSGWENEGFAFSYGSVINQLDQISVGAKYKLLINPIDTGAELYKDDVLYSTINSTFGSTYYNCMIFGRNVNGAVAGLSSIQLYSFKLYEGDELVKDFIPVIWNSNNTVGLFDKVNNVFYTNQGTGVFIAGPEKEAE